MPRKSKGKPLIYNEYVPEYTPKGKLTKRSKEELDEIRAQALFEKSVERFEGDDLIELISFGAVTYCFKQGVDLMQWFGSTLFGGVTKETTSFLSFLTVPMGFPVHVITDLLTGTTETKTIETFLPEEIFNKIVKKSEEERIKELKASITLSKNMIAKGEKTIERNNATIMAMNAALYGGESRPGGYVVPVEECMYYQLRNAQDPATEAAIKAKIQVWEKEIQRLQAQNESIYQTRAELEILLSSQEAELLAKSITEKGFEKAKWKVELAEWALAAGATGALRWFLKSYETYEAVENATITG